MIFTKLEYARIDKVITFVYTTLKLYDVILPAAQQKGEQMQKTALRKWGNGQGFLIPKATVAESGLKIGDQLDIDVSIEGYIILKPEISKHKRRRKVTITEIFEGYSGDYKPAEMDWGAPQGKEMW